MIIFVIVAARILYRATKPSLPALPGTMALWELRLTHLTLWLLYAVLIIMPVIAAGAERRRDSFKARPGASTA